MDQLSALALKFLSVSALKSRMALCMRSHGKTRIKLSSGGFGRIWEQGSVPKEWPVLHPLEEVWGQK